MSFNIVCITIPQCDALSYCYKMVTKKYDVRLVLTFVFGAKMCRFYLFKQTNKLHNLLSK